MNNYMIKNPFNIIFLINVLQQHLSHYQEARHVIHDYIGVKSKERILLYLFNFYRTH
jgi:hypothetical protein